jgi:SMC interacting uncharacterized protein involved in chromosome segregation
MVSSVPGNTPISSKRRRMGTDAIYLANSRPAPRGKRSRVRRGAGRAELRAAPRHDRLHAPRQIRRSDSAEIGRG